MTSDSQPAARIRGFAVGIDAGGSSTRARAVSDGAVVWEGSGGPGNPVMADQETLRASYHAALAGFPSPSRVAACVSGTSDEAKRAQIEDLLAERFPGVMVRVLPDYVASVMAAPPGTDVCVVAGTGSVVGSRDAAGTYCATGGRGWILGDHGSAARLGRAALEYVVSDPRRAAAPLAEAVGELFGDCDWRTVVRAVHAAPNPAPLLARAAPLLTRAAEDQAGWAIELLDEEMSALAASTAWHIEHYLHGKPEIRAALSGGVWTSEAARSSFGRALKQAVRCQVIVSQSMNDPLDGAVRLAENASRQ
jgi:N-acetylglucosamine kinase-like BadF-type ATPase